MLWRVVGGTMFLISEGQVCLIQFSARGFARTICETSSGYVEEFSRLKLGPTKQVSPVLRG
jgi:hypothetical protein